MTKPEDDYVLIDSPLSGPLRRDGVEIEVCIYRGEKEAGWILEVVDSEGNSFVWGDKFETDQAAFDELLRTIRVEGMKQFNPHYKRQMN
ncbi:MAG: hypothetical protein AB7U75_02195 [Hyphomicrobiaceae bacterium]